MENKNLPKRKRNRLENYDYSSCGAYFITICTKDRKNLFWERHNVGEDIILPPDKIKLSLYGKIAEDAIMKISEKYPHIELSEYVIMPNHIHMILFIPYEVGRIISSPTILTVVGQMKRYASKKIGASIWQKSFYDHVIRNKDDYESIAKYIYENPINWHLDELYKEEQSKTGG